MKWFWMLVAVAVLSSPGCVTKRVDLRRELGAFDVEIVTTPQGCRADEQDPCPYSTDPVTISVTIKALRPDGSIDTDFNDAVAISLVPAGMWPQDAQDVYPSPGGQQVLMVTLNQGVAENQPVSFRSAFGPIQLIVEDIGYRPRQVSNECLANGVDCPACWQGGSGLLPLGCFNQDDDNPAAGTGAVGVSRDLFFDNPRVADLQRVDEFHIDESPLAGFRVEVDGDDPLAFSDLSDCIDGQGDVRQLLVVTAVTNSGFYVTDVCNNGGPTLAPDTWREFGSIYAFNFNSPEGLRTGDCLLWFQGGQDDFYGFTELKNPAWSDPVCAPDQSGCMPACTAFLPEPAVLDAATINDDLSMEELESSLVAVQDGVIGRMEICDKNDNGQIDFDNQEENDCKRSCDRDPSCWVYESYTDYFQFTVNVDGAEVAVTLQGVVAFDPRDHQGQPISYVAGTLKHLSFGGPPWIVMPRNSDDFRE